MGNCIGSNKVTNPPNFSQLNLNPLQAASATPVCCSLKQFETGDTNDLNECKEGGRQGREKAVIVETSSEIVAGEQQ